MPSRGMAEAIAAAVLAREPRGVAGLRIRFLEELALEIVPSRVASEAERRLAMRLAVRSVRDPMMDGRGVASMLERSYRDVRDSGLTLAQVRTRGLRNPQRTQTVLRAFAEYERLIAQAGAIDPADLLAMAARAPKNLRPQLLAGFYDMTGAQRSFVDALPVAVVYVPTDLPFARAFVEGVPCSVTRASEPEARVTEHGTRFDEIRSVCTDIAELHTSGETSIAITARSLDPYDVRLINRFIRTTLADETPLSAHRMGRGAITLLRLRERGFPRGEVLELMRDGLHARARINVDRADYETRRARVAGGTSEELAPLRNRSQAIDDYIALVAELEELTSSLDFDRLGSLFRVETETDLIAAAKLDELAAIFRRMRSNDAPSFVDAIEHASLPCAATADGMPVWLGDVMRFRGRSFRHVFAIRMQDDVFPQRRTEDPLFPDSDRRFLGIREIGDGRDEEALLLQLIRDSAEQVHFSFASGDGFGKVLRPSRFTRDVFRVPYSVTRASAPGPQAVQHGSPNTEHGTRQLQLLAKSGTRSVFDGYLPNFTPGERPLSPTQLEDFGECPQKFLFKHILGVEDIEHPERELQINHRDKGSIDHRILERFYRATSAEEIASAAAALPRLPEELVARLERIIDEQFDEHERLAPPFNRTVRGIERRATKRILSEFLAADLADLAASELVPRHFEYRFGFKHKGQADHPEPFVVDAGGIAVKVEGTIDRIDAGAGRLRIVDYKSGKALRHANLAEKIDRGVRLQLALYAMAAAEFFEADAASVSGTIKPLVTGDGRAKFAFELQEKRDGLLATLEIFARSILKGLFPAFPNDSDQDFNSCKYCPVNHSCRTRHDQEERYAIQQQRDPRTLLGGGA